MSFPRPSLGGVVDDESYYQEFDDPLASDGSDFEEIAIVEAGDLFSDDDSFSHSHQLKIVNFKILERVGIIEPWHWELMKPS